MEPNTPQEYILKAVANTLVGQERGSVNSIYIFLLLIKFIFVREKILIWLSNFISWWEHLPVNAVRFSSPLEFSYFSSYLLLLSLQIPFLDGSAWHRASF